MQPQIYFWIVFISLTLIVIIFDRKYNMLRDISKVKPKPFSWSRTQLAWWTIIILSCFITILFSHHQAPDLNQSTLILLGISSATTAVGSIIDVSEINNANIASRSQDLPGDNFFLDILSDQTGVSVYRFQTIVFNFVFGVWFISSALIHMSDVAINSIVPTIPQNDLILLGLSSATYAALKTTENKTVKKDLVTTTVEGAVG